MKSFRNFVNGEWVDAADGATTDIVDPTTGEAYATSALSGDADVDAAMSAAATAFESWRNTTPAERSLALLKLADAMEARGDEIMHLECENTGKAVRGAPRRGDGPGGRQRPVLRRGGSPPRGQVGGGVHGGHDLVRPA